MNDFGFKIEIFQVGEKIIKNFKESLGYAWFGFFNKSFHAPGKMTDKVKSQRVEGAENRRGKTGKKNSHSGEHTKFNEDE